MRRNRGWGHVASQDICPTDTKVDQRMVKILLLIATNRHPRDKWSPALRPGELHGLRLWPSMNRPKGKAARAMGHILGSGVARLDTDQVIDCYCTRAERV